MAQMKKNKFLRMAVLFSSVMTALFLFRAKKKSASIYKKEPKERNPMEGKKVLFERDSSDAVNADGIRGHLVSIGQSLPLHSYYIDHVKRGFDFTLSFFALLVLSPVFLILSIAIFIDDPGPVFFAQKRVGKNKRFFKLHKFRSMKMSTPHDIPTHMLDNPEQYITRVGKFIRAHSLDELPQIWDIFLGNMSIIGPRPALWNQDCLIAERDRYGANDILPGLSGWAQINGRDSIEIPDKAKLDGEYVEKIGFLMDLRCFFGTIFSVLRKDGVVEGGTGQLKQRGYVDQDEDRSEIEYDFKVKKDKQVVRILITGAHSYIGEQVEQYLEEYNQKLFSDYPVSKRYLMDTISLFGEEWKHVDFSSYDVVFHVAGIAHGSVSEKTEQGKKQYFAVNRDLAYQVAYKAKEAGVKQFIFMSTMAVYGGNKEDVITKETIPIPVTAYGESKLQAEWLLGELEDEHFRVAILRPPMIYGKGCKGNYNALVKIAKLSPFFPKVNNRRSMLYIGNLCEFIRLLIDDTARGLFFPQNKEYVATCRMVQLIAKSNHWFCEILPGLKKPLELIQKLPGKVGRISRKVFSSLYYQREISNYREDYQIFSLEDSIKITEKEGKISCERRFLRKKNQIY